MLKYNTKYIGSIYFRTMLWMLHLLKFQESVKTTLHKPLQYATTAKKKKKIKKSKSVADQCDGTSRLTKYTLANKVCKKYVIRDPFKTLHRKYLHVPDLCKLGYKHLLHEYHKHQN